MSKIITLSVPSETKTLSAILESSDDSPYEAVDSIRSIWKKKLAAKPTPFEKKTIGEIMPIHNVDGIRDLNQISKMRLKVETGLELTEKDDLPNIKCIVAPNNQLLLFDGHHTILAYYLSGKKFLGEIPFIVISTPGYKPLPSSQIAYFFPTKDTKLITANWEDYVVNWQGEKQVEKRLVNSIEELALQLSKRNESSIK